MKKKVLIYYPENKLAPIGGPAGYLCNLKKELDCRPDDELEISFLPAVEETRTAHNFLKKHSAKRGQEFIRALKMMNLYKKKTVVPETFLNYDAIHFHSTEDLYFCRDALKNYTGKVILTSHTPCASFMEKLDRLNPFDRKLLNGKLETLKLIDKYAFQRADYIIFPCEEAEEPYYHTWKEYETIRDSRKYIYIPSGINACCAKVERAEIRKKYGIPQDAFLVSFAGRHNEIKGYADLKAIGEKLLEQNVWFLIAGNESPLKGLNHPHWIEVGWTKDPHSLIQAADLFILPNRETYFDLVMLEVLSLGQIVVASSTGGNRYFQKYGASGILLYDDLQQAIEDVNAVRTWGTKDVMQAKYENKTLFENHFTTAHFAKKYIEVLEEITHEKEHAD